MYFETERLILRNFTVNDAEFIFDLLNSPSWLQFIGNRGIRSLKEAEDYLMKVIINSYNKYGFGISLIQLKEKEIPIGMCGLVKREGLENIDIGFALLSQYEGYGYGFEAANVVLDHAKSSLGFSKVVGITSKENFRSINLLTKLGFGFEKTIKLPNDHQELLLFALSNC
jgi:[ribosomal protein S5]-alanine N-acetyltransferase